jgi:glyoxylase-like metal-dependent hydrolase (beta-lactamase superfamily II)
MPDGEYLFVSPKWHRHYWDTSVCDSQTAAEKKMIGDIIYNDHMKSSLIYLRLLCAVLMAPTVSSEHAVSANGLRADVYHQPAAPVLYQNSTELSFSPTAFTLIQGNHSAVLVDAPTTHDQGTNLTAWVKQTLGPNKTLKYIYITHGHGDHFFAAPQICAAFPGCQVVAKKDVNEHMQEQYTEPLFTTLWTDLFTKAQITSKPFDASVILPSNGTFELEGHQLQAVEVGQADTYNSTVLHIPDLSLVVGGDVVYGSCHQLFAEDYTPALRQAWIDSLHRVIALNTKYVVPSHTIPGDGFDATKHLLNTQLYIRTWEVMSAASKSWQELEMRMKTQYPGRAGNFILRWSSQAPFNASSIEA